MTNYELDQAINTAHRMLGGTSQDSQMYAVIKGHLLQLLECQKVRANLSSLPTLKPTSPSVT